MNMDSGATIQVCSRELPEQHWRWPMRSFPRQRTRADGVCFSTCLPASAPSSGGVESLITRPVLTSHAGMSPEDRERVGVTDDLVRVSVGIEDADDLIADFAQALDKV